MCIATPYETPTTENPLSREDHTHDASLMFDSASQHAESKEEQATGERTIAQRDFFVSLEQ